MYMKSSTRLRRAPLISITVSAVLVLLFLTLLQLQTGVHDPVTRLLRSRAATQQSCEFVGNADIYGLGIRLGVYLQWAASTLSKVYLASANPELLRELLDANTIFSIAIFVATALLTGGSLGDVRGVEILIMLHIYFGSTYIISYEQLLRGKHARGITFWGVTVMVFSTTGMSIYSVWFWFHGLDGLSTVDCEGYAFLFAKVALDGPARTFFKVVAIVNMIIWGIGFIGLGSVVIFLYGFLLLVAFALAVLAGVLRIMAWFVSNNDEGIDAWRRKNVGHGRYILALMFGVLGVPKGQREEQATFKKAQEGLNSVERTLMTYTGSQIDNPIARVWPFVSFCILVYSIIAIELIISWNSISGVYQIQSTGQIIPLVIGLAGLLKVLFTISVRGLANSAWSPNNESFRLLDRTWATFPINKPQRRNSWAGG